MNCPKCTQKLTRKTLPTYEAGALLGMRRVTVQHLPALVCAKCASVIIDGGIVEMLHRRLLLAVLQSAHLLCGEEVRFIRKALELSQAALAERLGVHRVSVARWESNEVPLDGPTSVAIRALAAIPVVARPGMKKEDKGRVTGAFERPLTSEAPGGYTLSATG